MLGTSNLLVSRDGLQSDSNDRQCSGIMPRTAISRSNERWASVRMRLASPRQKSNGTFNFDARKGASVKRSSSAREAMRPSPACFFSLFPISRSVGRLGPRRGARGPRVSTMLKNQYFTHKSQRVAESLGEPLVGLQLYFIPVVATLSEASEPRASSKE